MNPPNWRPAPKPTRCPCPQCHLARYEDLAYAVAKGGDPITIHAIPLDDAMHWTPTNTTQGAHP